MGALGLSGALSATASGCSSASTASYADGGAPAFSDATGVSPPDGAFVPGDAAGGGDTGAPGVAEDAGPTTILAVHASANLYDFRLCFGVADAGILAVPAYPDDPAHPMPETNYPGVPVGGAVLLPALEIPNALVTVYVVPAYYLTSQHYVGASEPTCDQLIPQDLIPQNVEFFTLPAVTFPGSGTMVLAIEGCGVGTGLGAGSVAQCGAGYGAGGNLSAMVATLAPSEDAGAWGVQIAQLSPSFGQGGDGGLTYVDPTIDASVPLSLPASAASVGAAVTVPLSEAGVTAAYFVMGSSPSVAQSLSAIQYFQAPSSDPFTYFSAPATYFVAVVGDATDAAAPASFPDGAANPAFDGHGLHVIAYPEQ